LRRSLARSVDMSGFTVDPRIFHELGALLVKRDSIALTELIKNAYDADAQSVRILGEDLTSPDGRIVVADDGIGMTARQFRDGFLRIASRTKDTQTRRSEVFGRRFTGEKGIGRLSAHKLGAVLGVQTVALSNREEWSGTRQVAARVDWDEVEKQSTLEDLPERALRVRSSVKNGVAGTRIEIARLRRAWTDAELTRFIAEADLFEPPRVLLDPVRQTTGRTLLFKELLLRDSRSKSDTFEVELHGDFRVGEQLWQQVPEAASWVVEISAEPERVVVHIEPTKLGRERREYLTGDRFVLDEEDPHRPRFQARIFAREGRRSARDRSFTTQVSGVRVYMEGFRISPYGERGDDWLSLDHDYARRTDQLGLALPTLAGAATADREGLRTLPNRAYVGAVLLTHAGAPGLEAPIDREGFLESPQLESLRRAVRLGLDLLTRHRARLGVAEGISEEVARDAAHVVLADEVRVRDGLASAVGEAQSLRRKVSAGEAPLDEVEALAEALADLSEVAGRAVSDRAMLRILAAAGTQMAVFVHEIQNIVSALASIRRQIHKLSDQFPDAAQRLQAVDVNLAAVEERVNAQAGYLSDVATVGSRARRRRLRLSEAVERAWHLVEPAAKRLDVGLTSEVDASLRTPPMFPAELSAVLSNLLTNAIKAAGEGGRIRVISKKAGTTTTIRFENTGARVALDEAERWFLPFESTSTTRLDPLLGQGMGLGLPIVRSILTDYGSTIRFTEPSHGMATSIEVRFP
jgi:signal transduction histidine kinase